MQVDQYYRLKELIQKNYKITRDDLIEIFSVTEALMDHAYSLKYTKNTKAKICVMASETYYHNDNRLGALAQKVKFREEGMKEVATGFPPVGEKK